VGGAEKGGGVWRARAREVERRGNGAGEEGRREKDARWGKGGLAEACRIGQVFPVCRRRASAWRLILYLACPRVSAAVTLTPGTPVALPLAGMWLWTTGLASVRVCMQLDVRCSQEIRHEGYVFLHYCFLQ
jgi:hypothetical protein